MYDQSELEHQDTGDGNALALLAGEFVWVVDRAFVLQCLNDGLLHSFALPPILCGIFGDRPRLASYVCQEGKGCPLLFSSLLVSLVHFEVLE